MKPRLKLEWLAYFEVLAGSESFQQAAQELFITQQALSNYLVRLERRLGICLLDRDSQGKKELTPEGVQFLQALRPVLTKAHSLQDYFQQLYTARLDGLLRVAIEPLWMSAALSQRFLQIQTHHPNMRLEILGNLTESQMLGQLLDGEVDLAIMSEVQRHPQLAYLPLFYSSCVLVASEASQQHWSDMSFIRYVRPTDPYTLMPAGSFATFWPEQRYPRRVVVECNHLIQAIECCQKGLGVLYLPRVFVEPWLQSQLLYECGEAPELQEITASLVWNPERAYGAAHEYLMCEVGKLFQPGKQALDSSP